MKVIKKMDGVPYEADKHFGVWSVRKLAADQDSRKLTVSLSHFLPNGGVEMSGSPSEKIYYILNGKMLVKTKSEEMLIQAGDTVYLYPGEERAISIPGDEVCTVLVCIVKM